jgi:hypothetical protein
VCGCRTSTLQFGLLLCVGIVSLLVHVCVELATEHTGDGTGQGAVSMVFVFALVFLYPALVGFVMAVYSWKIQNWSVPLSLSLSTFICISKALYAGTPLTDCMM